MSCAQVHSMARRLCAAALGSLFLLMLTGCYSRQIEGLQKDLNTLDRKLHTMNQNSKGAPAAKAVPSQSAVLQLEDRLNEVTLQQSDLTEEVRNLRQNYADIKTAPASPSSGGSVDKTKLNSLERQVAENNRKTQSMQKEVNELKSTFESMRTETKNLISLLKEEFGEDGSGAPEASHNNQVSSTVVEDPPATVVAKSEPEPAATPAAPPASPAKKKEEKKTLVASAAGGKTYEVRPRDTLSTIAKKFGVSQEELQRVNHIDDPKGIKMGQTLRIP